MWKESHRHKFTWLERQVIFGRIEIVEDYAMERGSQGGLVLSRKPGEVIYVGESVVEVVRVRGERVSLRIVAPREVVIERGEIRKDAA